MVAFLIMAAALVVGTRYPGVLIAGLLLTYQARTVAGVDFLGIAYVVSAVVVSIFWFFREGKAFKLLPIDLLFAVMILWMCVSSVYSDDPNVAGTVALRLFTSASVYVAARLVPVKNPRRLIVELSIGLMVAGSLLATQLASAAQHAYVERLMVGRASAVGLSQPLPFEFVAAAVCALVAASWRKTPFFLVAVIGFLICLYASVQSATRSVFLAGGFALLALFLAYRRELRMGRLAVLLATTAAAAFAALPQLLSSQGFSLVAARLLQNFGHTGERDLSSYGRIVAYGQAIDEFLRKPLFGGGVGGFTILNPQFGYPHNLFLEVAAEFGLIGLCIVTVYLIQVWRQINLVRRHVDLLAGSALLAMFVAALVQQQVSFAFFMQRPLFVITGLTGAIIAAYATHSPRSTGRTSDDSAHPVESPLRS